MWCLMVRFELYFADAITVITCDGRIIVVGPLRKLVIKSECMQTTLLAATAPVR